MNKLLILLITGIWIGLVLGLSFIEAPLKFQAPGITTELGLGIGKLVFGTLNKIEIGATILIIILFIKHFQTMTNGLLIASFIVFFIIFIQSVFLLPALTERVDLILSGQTIPSSNHHIIFIALEVSKLIALITVFIKTYKL